MNAVTTTVETRAERIREHMATAVEHVVAVGRELLEAKAELPHGEFGRLLEAVQLSRATASRLMRVAEHPVLSNVAHGQHLPASWRTLAELARLDEDVLEEAIDTGQVSPTMTRTQASALVGRHRIEHDVREQQGRFAPVPGPSYGPHTWEQLPDPPVVLLERLVRQIVGAKNGMILDAERALDFMLSTVTTLASHIGITRDEIDEQAREYEAELRRGRDADYELDKLLEFAHRIGYRLGEGFEHIVVDRHDPFIESLGGVGTLPDDILVSIAWVYLNVRFHHLGLASLVAGVR